MRDILYKLLFSAAPRAYYNILLNALGFNVLRAYFYNLLWKLRKAFSKEEISDFAYDALKKDGVVIIENFLPHQDFEALMAAYKTAELVDKYPERKNVPQYAALEVANPIKISHENIAKYFIENERLNNIVKAASGRKINVFPKITLEKFYADKDVQINGQFPGQSDSLHYDVPFNSIRAFLYLKPCNENNAAFVYGKGTHHLNSKRLKFEYYDSIKQAVKRSAIPSAPLDEIDEDLLKELGYKPSIMEGKENCLVIFNSMGLHKRGRFKQLGSREAVLIDFRTLDTPLNLLMGLPVIRDMLKKIISKS